MSGLLPIPGGWLAALLLTIAGLVMCFAGSKLLRLALGLAGFLIVGTLAATLVALLTHSPIWATLVFILCGLIGGGVAGALLTPGMFLLGLAFGYSISLPLVPYEIIAWLAALVTGILFAVLRKRIIAIATAGLGALLTLEGVVMVVLDVPALSDRLVPLLEGYAGAIALAVLWVLLALAGTRAQLRKKEEKDGKK